LEALLIGQDAAVDGVGDASFQAAAGLFDGLVFGNLAAVVIAPGTGVAGLGDGSDVDGGVELPVPSSREPVGLLVAARDVDRCGARVAGVVLLVGKAANVAGQSEDIRGGEEPDALDLGERGAAGGDLRPQLLPQRDGTRMDTGPSGRRQRRRRWFRRPW
jgi:hypothetical protein